MNKVRILLKADSNHVDSSYMDMPQILTRNKVATAICFLLVGVLFSVGSLVLLVTSADSPAKQNANQKVGTTTTTHTQGSAAADETTTSTSTSTSTTSSTTTTTPATTTTVQATTTTAIPLFHAIPTATQSGQHTTFCDDAYYTFSGTVTANVAGTFSYEWVRSDGTPSGVSGTASINSSGELVGTIAPLKVYVNYYVDSSGWVALKVTWNGGTTTSAHASFVYDYPYNSLESITPQIC